MSTGRMLRRFDEWRAEGRPLVLASVFETAGSTYSKAGTQMLITGDGDFQGLLSGGCLEGDLAERATRVSASGQPEAVTYDLGGADDELFGLGVGCDGTMRIFLQPLSPPDYQPFAAVADCLRGEETGVLATVIEGDGEACAAGDYALTGAGGAVVTTSLSGAGLAAIQRVSAEHRESGVSATESTRIGGSAAKVLYTVIAPPPRLLVLGAGLDVVPVVDLAARLGWRVVVRDHRPAYFDMGDFGRAERCIAQPAETLAASEELENAAAAIVMSHHLATDRVYLAALADSSIPYIGLLGPRRRRLQLLDDLGEAGERLAHRLHGPAGLDIGAQGAESIALSIVAEIQAELAGRASGTRLGPPARDAQTVREAG